MHRYKNPGGTADLSLLARGTGLLGGGVEVECFGEDRRAFTLNGEPFIKPSKSPEGQYAKPYRRCQLTLPKTYITRRGQMVLFTSPEDMIIGQSVALQHRKEITSETAATRLKTVNKLVSSSLGYEPNKTHNSEVGEFTSVYLQRLREAAEKAKETENYQAQSLDRVDEKMEEDDLDAADSGMGASLRPSSGRISSLSHFSEGTLIQIPDGKLMEDCENENMDTPVDPLKQLAGELGMSTGQKLKSKPAKGSKKKKTSSEQSTSTKQKSSKTKGKKRKRSKKAQKDDTDGAGGGVASQGGSKVNGKDRKSELERKKMEKRDLERQREIEARERARLEEELRRLQQGKRERALGGELDGEGEGEMEGRVKRECGGVRRGQVIAGVRGEDSERRREDIARRKRDERTEAEKAQLAHEKGAKMREQSNYNDHLELNSLRHSQSISAPWTFSYFRYVPPRTSPSKTEGRGGGGKGGRMAQRTKRKKPSEK